MKLTNLERGWKQCSKCERRLSMDRFYGKPGRWLSRCKTCHHRMGILRMRRIRKSPEYRAKENERFKARYHSDAAYRRRKIAYSKIYNRRMKVGVVEDIAGL